MYKKNGVRKSCFEQLVDVLTPAEADHKNKSYHFVQKCLKKPSFPDQ